MTLYDLMGLISTVALWLPILLLLAFKLAWYRTFPALLGFISVLCVYNLLLIEFLAPSSSFVSIVEKTFYFTAGPLVLLFLSYYCRTAVFRKKILMLIAGLLVFETTVAVAKGFSDDAFGILAVPGLVLALGMGLYFFARQVKLTITFQKGVGKAFLVSAVLFATVGISYIYGVRFYTNPAFRHDAQLIQFMICFLFGGALSIGLYFEHKHVKELEEIRIAREELKEIYGESNEKATGPFGTVALNFDQNESWN